MNAVSHGLLIHHGTRFIDSCDFVAENNNRFGLTRTIVLKKHFIIQHSSNFQCQFYSMIFYFKIGSFKAITLYNLYMLVQQKISWDLWAISFFSWLILLGRAELSHKKIFINNIFSTFLWYIYGVNYFD